MGDHWESSWDLFVEAAVHPTFPDSEVSLVRQQLINSLRRREQFPDDVLSRVADSVFFAGHPYGIDPAGSVGALSALIRNDLQAWHRERMTKENLLLVVVGNLSQADLEAKVGRAFGGLPDRGGTALRPPALARGRSGVTIVPRSIPTNYVQGLFSAPSLDHPDYAAMRVAIEILSNRVFEEVRSKRNLAYRARAGLDDRRANTGLLYVSTVQPETTLKVMRHEVERLQTEPITPKRLGETVNVFLTRYFLDQETNSDQAQTLATYELLGGGWQRAATFLQRVRAVTPTDVQRVAREYIQNVSFTILGDSTNIDLARLSSM
jgi:zinc protease